jgi:hypothetical protein
MNAYSFQPFHGRLAELSPFEIRLAEPRGVAVHNSGGASRQKNTGNVSIDELFGCVDWYRYPDPAEREPGNRIEPGGTH